MNEKWRPDGSSHLEVLEGDPPLVGWIVEGARDQLGPAEVGDGLAAVRVLGGGVNLPAAVEPGRGAVVLQLHGVQREPAASRHLVATLAHRKAGTNITRDERRTRDTSCVCVCVFP